MSNNDTKSKVYPEWHPMHDRMQQMSLRDYFAAKAMPVAWGMYEELYDCSPEDVIPLVADYAYDLADAMLKRREA